jgi:hypothetical protein
VIAAGRTTGTSDFQAVDQFTLASSLLPNDSFDIRLRLAPYTDFLGFVSIITQVRVSLGAADITFDSTRQDPVYLNDAPTTISGNDPIISLPDGSVTSCRPTSGR